MSAAACELCHAGQTLPSRESDSEPQPRVQCQSNDFWETWKCSLEECVLQLLNTSIIKEVGAPLFALEGTVGAAAAPPQIHCVCCTFIVMQINGVCLV